MGEHIPSSFQAVKRESKISLLDFLVENKIVHTMCIPRLKKKVSSTPFTKDTDIIYSYNCLLVFLSLPLTGRKKKKKATLENDFTPCYVSLEF